MPTMEIVRAWKDEEYRDTLTAEQKAQLPKHPSGVIELEQSDLEDENLFGPVNHRCKYTCGFYSNNYTETGKCR